MLDSNTTAIFSCLSAFEMKEKNNFIYRNQCVTDLIRISEYSINVPASRHTVFFKFNRCARHNDNEIEMSLELKLIECIQSAVVK